MWRLVPCRPTTEGFRIEHDTMGEVRVPADALWRAQTQRAVENFPISGRGLERAQIRALGLVKAAAARVNGRHRGAGRRGRAADRRGRGGRGRRGQHDAQFPIDVFQTGSGTSSNMNANEVIATLASSAGRRRCTRTTTSTPRSRPTTSSRRRSTSPPPRRWPRTWSRRWSTWRASLRRRADDWADVVKAGRTHLMDAVPITLGQEAGGWATQADTASPGCATCSPAWASCRSAAPRSAPGSTPRRVRRGGRRGAARRPPGSTC